MSTVPCKTEGCAGTTRATSGLCTYCEIRSLRVERDEARARLAEVDDIRHNQGNLMRDLVEEVAALQARLASSEAQVMDVQREAKNLWLRANALAEAVEAYRWNHGLYQQLVDAVLAYRQAAPTARPDEDEADDVRGMLSILVDRAHRENWTWDAMVAELRRLFDRPAPSAPSRAEGEASSPSTCRFFYNPGCPHCRKGLDIAIAARIEAVSTPPVRTAEPK